MPDVRRCPPRSCAGGDDEDHGHRPYALGTILRFAPRAHPSSRQARRDLRCCRAGSPAAAVRAALAAMARSVPGPPRGATTATGPGSSSGPWPLASARCPRRRDPDRVRHLVHPHPRPRIGRPCKPASIDRTLAAIAVAHQADTPQPYQTGARLVLRGYEAALNTAKDPRGKTRKASAGVCISGRGVMGLACRRKRPRPVAPSSPSPCPSSRGGLAVDPAYLPLGLGAGAAGRLGPRPEPFGREPHMPAHALPDLARRTIVSAVNPPPSWAKEPASGWATALQTRYNPGRDQGTQATRPHRAPPRRAPPFSLPQG